ncbi:MAG TPA: hypothetical protein VMT70_11580 [Vicinamibacteria bacterium]|nr:hypothetical protein [Vicinamibacteria bacterium]
MRRTVSSLVLLVLPLLAATAVPADLCPGLVTDKAAHPMTALAKPAVGQAVRDPQLGGTLRRITAAGPVPGSDTAIVPVYSTISAWNADESLLLLYHVGRGHELYDGRSYRFLRALDIAPNDIENVYWHTSDPDILYFLSGTSLMRYRPSTGAHETVHTFSFCTGPITPGSDPTFTSWDSDVFGLKCGQTAFYYHVSSNTLTGTGTTSGEPPKPAPSGTLGIADGWVYDINRKALRQLDLANPYEHACPGRLLNGRDVWSTVAFDPGPAGSGVGSLVTFDLANGTSRVIVGPATGYPYPPGGTHVSTLSYRAPGWTFLSIIGSGSGQGVLDNELVVADASSGKVCRAAHHRSLGTYYWSEPHVVPSPTGTRAVFGSDWGGGASVDTYVLELPADPGVTLTMGTDRAAYRTGNTMATWLAIANAAHAATVDLLLFLVMPDGDQVSMITPQGPKTGRLSQPAGLVPALSGVSLASAFNSRDALAAYTWTGSETAGTYAWVLAAIKPGSLADNTWNEGDVIAEGSVAFSFTR